MDAFDQIQLDSPEVKPKFHRNNGKGDAFDYLPDIEESFLKSAGRTILQPFQGIAEATGPGLTAGLIQFLGAGEALDPEEIDRIKVISEREGIPFDEEKYMENVGNALKYFPTVANIGRELEDRTGIPFEPKGFWQNVLRFAGFAGKAIPVEGIQQKAIAGSISGIAKETMKEADVPEPLAELFALSFAPAAATQAGFAKGFPTIGTEKKPSGLTTRRFEKIEKPIEVSPGKIKKINEKIENEFRDIANDIIEKSPIAQTYSELKSNPEFKAQSRESFKEVERLASEIPDIISTKDVKKKLVDLISKEKGTGFLPSEYEKNHKKFISQFLKETPNQRVSTLDLVKQYRKNNAGFGQIKEPGQSFAYNKAKRDALLDYNRAISEIFEQRFPDSEFSNLFKSDNKRWSEIMDAEAIDAFMNKMFDGKIKFEEGRKFFDREGMTMPFKRALGEEGFKNFQQLMKDLLSTQKASQLMKAAEKKGFEDLVKTGMAFVLHPTLGKFQLAYKVGKNTLKSLYQLMLDKPQLTFVWDKGVQAFKKGDFVKAEKNFNILKGEILEAEKPKTSNKSTPEFELKPEKIPKQIELKPKEKILEKPIEKEVETKNRTTQEIEEELKGLEKTPQEVFRTPSEKAKENVARKRALREQLQKKENEKVISAEKESFTTSKGSTYQVNEDGSTTRVKMARPEHPGEEGIQPKSEKTWYVTPEDSIKLGEFQTMGKEKKIVELPNGQLGVQYLTGKDKGKIEQRTLIDFSRQPEEGLIPVEAWDEGKKIHFGNQIVITSLHN